MNQSDDLENSNGNCSKFLTSPKLGPGEPPQQRHKCDSLCKTLVQELLEQTQRHGVILTVVKVHIIVES